MKTSKTIKFYRITSYLLMLGVIHSALTPVFYKPFFSIEALWFLGTGLSLVFLSMLNIASSRILDKWNLKLTIIGNIIGTIFSFLILLLIPKPQAIIGLLFHLIVLIASIAALKYLKKLIIE